VTLIPRASTLRAAAAVSTVLLAGTAISAAAASGSTSAAGSTAAAQPRPVVAAAAAAPRTAAATDPAPTLTAVQKRLGNRLNSRAARTEKNVKGSVSGLLVDNTTGLTVWSRSADRGVLPASTTKLGTAVAVLDTLGPDARFTTTVARTAKRKVVLVGGGDPALSSANLRKLANATATKLKAQNIGKVAVTYDDTLFGAPSAAKGWRSSYYNSNIAPVRALGIDGRSVTNTGRDAADVYAAALRKAGMKVTGIAAAKRPAGSAVLATHRSAPLRSIVARMQEVSDNDYAEYLLRHVALGTGVSPTWKGSLAAQRSILKRLEVPLAGVKLNDGSGLSRSNRIPPRTLVDIVRKARADERLVAAVDTLPIAGKTGSLRPARGRFTTSPNKCAAGKATGKTGHLTGSVALAGELTGPHGRSYTYAIVINGTSANDTVKRQLDNLVATAVGCW
jgi:D-alanyl-D-alanine carboxypeptidase/D-alanyl-D-alanine-endopeptidase (penicillin-binding protein 4)